jgi:hypothetical protein
MALKLRGKEECEELCRKRIAIEKILGVREIDYEKCVRICKAFALK